MFDEFELKLPAASRLYLSLANVIANGLGPFAIVCFVLAILYLFTPLGLRLRRFYRRTLPGGYSARSRRSALQLLALSLRGKSSMQTATSLLGKIHPAPILRRRFRMASRRIEAGGDPWPSLAEQHLVTNPQSHSLSAMRENDLQIWTLLRFPNRN